MHPIKMIWAARAILYKPFFKHIGKLTYIGKPTFCEGTKHISIGKRNRIFPGLRIQTLNGGSIKIGDNVAIEQNVHITSAIDTLKIGNDCTILANCFITNIDHDYRDISKSVLEQGIDYKETIIGDGSFIGIGAAIQAGTKLGMHCVVGANSVVRGTFPDYCVLAGVPAKIIKKYDIDKKEWVREIG